MNATRARAARTTPATAAGQCRASLTRATGDRIWLNGPTPEAATPTPGPDQGERRTRTEEIDPLYDRRGQTLEELLAFIDKVVEPFLNARPGMRAYFTKEELRSDLWEVARAAIAKYDPTLQVPFKAYLHQQITYGILQQMRAADTIPRSVRGDYNLIVDAMGIVGATAPLRDVAARAGITYARANTVMHIVHSSVPVSWSSAEGQELSEGLPQTICLEPEAAVLAADVAAEVDTALASLSDRQREVMKLLHWEQMSQAEIATRLNITPARVSQHVTKAHEKLREALGEVDLDTSVGTADPLL